LFKMGCCWNVSSKDISQEKTTLLSSSSINGRYTSSYYHDTNELNLVKADEILIIQVVGSGAFSVVYEAIWRNKPVAVKILKDDQRYYIERECSIMSKLNHPNVIPFLGACFETSNNFIITEYFPRGSLSRIIGDRNYKYEIEHCRRMLIDICVGMIYIHDCNIIHNDLKPANLLITQDWKIKVADFGEAIILPNDYVRRYSGCSASVDISYTPPEKLRDDSFSQKVDIWSFGLIALSLITRTRPYPRRTDPQIVISVLSGKRPKIPISAPAAFKNLIKKCLRFDPKDRSSFKELYHTLDSMVLPKPKSEIPLNKSEIEIILL